MTVLIFAFSAALAAANGIFTCTDDVLNITPYQEMAGNYTYRLQQFGLGIFYARAGAGPLGFLTAVTTIAVYFGVTAGLERGLLSALPLPRITGSPVAAHSLMACLLMYFLAFHIVGHLQAKVMFDNMNNTERAMVGLTVSCCCCCCCCCCRRERSAR